MDTTRSQARAELVAHLESFGNFSLSPKPTTAAQRAASTIEARQEFATWLPAPRTQFARELCEVMELLAAERLPKCQRCRRPLDREPVDVVSVVTGHSVSIHLACVLKGDELA